jgi:exonuclease SbcC
MLASKADAERAVSDLEAKVAAAQEANDRLMGALAERDAVKAEQSQLKERMAEVKARMERLEAEEGGQCPLCGQLLSAGHRAAVLADLGGQGTEMGAQFRSNQTRLASLEEEIGGLQKRVALRAGLERDLLAQRQRFTTTETQLENLRGRLKAWQETGAERLTAIEARLTDAAEFEALEAELAELEKALAGRPTLQATRAEAQRAVSNAEARLHEIERAVQNWQKGGEAELATVRAQLEEERFALEHRDALAALEAEMLAIGYEAEVHQAALRERAALAEAPTAHQALAQARSTVDMLNEALAELTTQIEAEALHLTELEAQLAQAEARLAEMTEGAVDGDAMERDVFALREQAIQANRRVGAAEQQLAVLKTLREQRMEHKERRAVLTQHISRLRLLERACGRDGVQALLIEQALPEIEDNANELLERLTDGQMRVRFDTQRQLKTRDELAETLDIHISDGVGERPYESFSGGEQFRVNFAIRLALSRVLAQRAGARLRTLVIDEGFGSQDPVGRQRLVEAINTIQDDFSRILVITHIDQLRDAFPTRIQVEKQPNGSVVTVV